MNQKLTNTCSIFTFITCIPCFNEQQQTIWLVERIPVKGKMEELLFSLKKSSCQNIFRNKDPHSTVIRNLTEPAKTNGLNTPEDLTFILGFKIDITFV